MVSAPPAAASSPKEMGRADTAKRPSGRADLAMLLAAALLGAAASSYLVAAGTSVGQHLFGQHLWFFENAQSLSPRHVGAHVAMIRMYVALATLVLAWLIVGLVVRRSAVSMWWLVAAGAAWALPLLLGPPLFSPDAYAYTAIGASMHHGVDPYLAGAHAAGNIPAVRGVEPFWWNSPSPYSPLILDLLAALSWVLREHMLAVLVAWRGLTLAALVAVGWSVTRLARDGGQSPTCAVWLAVLNPLTMITAVSANHNDILMLAFLLPGLLLALRGRPLLGLVFCTLAAGVKVVALVAVVAIALDQAWRQRDTMRRLGAVAVTGLAGVLLFVLSVELSGRGWGWVHDLSVPNRGLNPMTPSVSVAYLLDGRHPPLSAVWTAGQLATVIVCVLLLTRLGRWGLVRTTAWMLFVVVTLGAVVWPWYLLWSLALFAAAGAAREKWLVAILSVGMLFTTLPGGQPAMALLHRRLSSQVVLAVSLLVLLGWLVTLVVQHGQLRRGGGRLVPS